MGEHEKNIAQAIFHVWKNLSIALPQFQQLLWYLHTTYAIIGIF